MKTLRELLTQYSDHRVDALTYLLKYYYDGHQDTQSVWSAFDKVWTRLIPLEGKPSDELSAIAIRAVAAQDEEWYEVYGIGSDIGETFSLDFVVWESLIDLNITDDTFNVIKDHEIIAHILWEITFWGWTEGAVRERRTELIESEEEINNCLDDELDGDTDDD